MVSQFLAVLTFSNRNFLSDFKETGIFLQSTDFSLISVFLQNTL